MYDFKIDVTMEGCFMTRSMMMIAQIFYETNSHHGLRKLWLGELSVLSPAMLGTAFHCSPLAGNTEV